MAMMKAVQQFQLRTALGTQQRARETLRAMKQAGYEGIELNGFMIKKMPPIVRLLCSAAGMPVGRSGKLPWLDLVRESGLKVVSVHEDLGSVLKRPQEMIDEASAFGTRFIVITGMHRFDYSDQPAVKDLVARLNQAGAALKEAGIELLYHNHNCEFLRPAPGKTAFEMLLEQTDPACVNFEFDSYWPTEAGCDALALMHRLGQRMKLWHINDRGSRPRGKGSSILKADSMELGDGNMNLVALLEAAKQYGVEAVVLESHRNWLHNSPVESFQRSALFLNEYV